MRLTLLVPQLIWPEPEDTSALGELSTPSLEWLLAHGVLSRGAEDTYETALASGFGLNGEAPFGPLRLLGEKPDRIESDAREGFWLCADPVHLRFHHERIILADAGAFDIGEEDASDLVAGLNKEFSDIGTFILAGARRWYVRLNADTPFGAQPLSAVAGRRLAGELPSEPHSAGIRSWLNEIQMYLHDHPVNSRRAKSGHPAVNSLWLWGAGRLPASMECDYDSICASEPLAIGHGRAAGIPVHGLPQDLAGLLAHAAADTRHFVVIDDPLPPVIHEDSRAWRDTLNRLEKDWFAPLKASLGKQVEAITLVAPTVYGCLTWNIKAADRWKVWRRPQPLSLLAIELAQ